MIDREKVIKGLRDARRYLEDKEWSDRGASPHIDAINDVLALLKEQEAMNVDTFVQWCIDSHIMGDATVRGIKYWVGKFKKGR